MFLVFPFGFWPVMHVILAATDATGFKGWTYHAKWKILGSKKIKQQTNSSQQHKKTTLTKNLKTLGRWSTNMENMENLFFPVRCLRCYSIHCQDCRSSAFAGHWLGFRALGILKGETFDNIWSKNLLDWREKNIEYAGICIILHLKIKFFGCFWMLLAGFVSKILNKSVKSPKFDAQGSVWRLVQPADFRSAKWAWTKSPSLGSSKAVGKLWQRLA